jgi:hypothetical protein
MTERGMFSLPSFRCCIKLKLEETVKTSFGGSLLKKVCSRLSLLLLGLPGRHSFSLKECVANSNSFKGGLFYVVGGSWKDPHFGQS